VNYNLLTAPTALPVDYPAMKEHLRVTHDNHESLIIGYIEAATERFERDANVCLKTQTWQAFFDESEVCETMELWKYPISAISSVKYYDTDNYEQTQDVSERIEFIKGRPAKIVHEDTPSVYERPDAMTVEFVAGFTSIPKDILLAIKLEVARLYENPSDPVDEKIGYVEKVIARYRSYGNE
jgi:uncharacterized phiE125 gp8 family phage protein